MAKIIRIEKLLTIQRFIGGFYMRVRLRDTCDTIFYDLIVEFHPKLSEEEILEIINRHFSDEDYIVSRKGRTLKAIWEVPSDEGGYEVENSMFYVLKDGEYGMYSYERRIKGMDKRGII